jgi:hypothetical protein
VRCSITEEKSFITYGPGQPYINKFVVEGQGNCDIDFFTFHLISCLEIIRKHVKVGLNYDFCGKGITTWPRKRNLT